MLSINVIKEKLLLFNISLIQIDRNCSLGSEVSLKCQTCNNQWSDTLKYYINYSGNKPKACPLCGNTRWTTESISYYLKETNLPFRLAPNQEIKNGRQNVIFLCNKNHQTIKPFYEFKAYHLKTKEPQYCKDCRDEIKKDEQIKYFNDKIKDKLQIKVINTEGKKESYRLIMECKKGHVFKFWVSNLNIKLKKSSGQTGCVVCDDKMWTIQKIHLKIEESGFKVKLVDNVYINGKSPMKFKCLNCGEVKKVVWNEILKKINKNHKDKTYCRKCHIDKLRTWNISSIKKELKKQNIPIKCISKEYKTNKIPMKWECLNCEFRWKNNWKSILHQGQRCPECSFVGKTEIAIRDFLIKVMNCRFKKIKPSWLVNPKTNRKLEIDCWNAHLKLGIEINGEHHYKFMPRFHETIENLYKIQEKDRFKKETFKKLNFTLIQLPIHDCKKNEIKERLKDYLIDAKIAIPKSWDEIPLVL